MHIRPLIFSVAVFCLALLSACAFDRADDAAAAKKHMLGLSREEVLACMGPPKRKASEGTTEVWSYLSTDKHGTSVGNSLTDSGYTLRTSEHDKSFCTVNVVMKDGVVKAIHYNGPTSSNLFSKDDECGYAVKNCVPHETEE